MRKYVAITTLICHKFNIVTDIGEEGVITETKPAVYGLNEEAFEPISSFVHLGYKEISRVSANFGHSQDLFVTHDTFVTPAIT